MRILHVIPSFYPATYWGGPIFSVYGLCNALARNTGCQIRVLTTDTAGPRLSERVDVTEIPTRYPAGYDVFFARRIFGKETSPGLLWRLWPMVRWADVVHLTGTYSFPTIPTLLACRLLKKSLVWSPRGALQLTEEWKGAKKRKLKKVWEKICAVAMPKKCILHVTSEKEREASLERLPNAVATMIPNGTDIPELLPPRQWRPDGLLRLLFLGRLDPQKGIENLLEALSQIESNDVRLDIYGTGDPSYSRRLACLANDLRLGDRVRFHGRVEAEEKTIVFMSADLCVVPSHGENFGMVVIEALAHGIPVIVSKGTPWAEVEEKGCGCWVENSPDSLSQAILAMRSCDLAEMGQRGRRWMEECFGWDMIAAQMYGVYEELLAPEYK